MRSLTLGQVAQATGGALTGDPALSFSAISTDTRTLPPGALFVALRGDRHDGHDHAAAARARGAAALLVERAATAGDLPHVVVPDTRRAYGDLARFYRDTFAIPVVGVTGSVGKTTTKEMIADVLRCRYAVHRSEANFNNEIGVPQTLFGLGDPHTALVVEMGMRGPGEIARLAEIARPTIGVITNIGLSHVERLGSQEAVADAKGELLAALPPDGVAVLPADDPFFSRLRARFAGETLSCAVEGRADVVASDPARHGKGWRFTVCSPWGRTKLFLPTPGRFNIRNALLAVAVGGRLDVPLASIARALSGWTPPAMRLEVITTERGIVILSDAYNAAPDSMRGALETLRDHPARGSRIAVLGEMRELGPIAEAAHAEVGRAAAQAAPDRLVLIGPLTDALGSAACAAGYPEGSLLRFATTDEAAEALPPLVAPGDVVLIKGSRALAMERIVERLTASRSSEVTP